MTVKEIEKAVIEAQRFIEAAKMVLKSTWSVTGMKGSFIETGRNSGTLRRASMDLTRSLADMRNP